MSEARSGFITSHVGALPLPNAFAVSEGGGDGAGQGDAGVAPGAGGTSAVVQEWEPDEWKAPEAGRHGRARQRGFTCGLAAI